MKYCSSTSDLTRQLENKHSVQLNEAKLAENAKKNEGSGTSMADYLVALDTTTFCEESTVIFVVEKYQSCIGCLVKDPGFLVLDPGSPTRLNPATRPSKQGKTRNPSRSYGSWP